MKENIQFVGKCLLIVKEGEKILVIGDLHLGYEEILNEMGMFISRKMFDDMVDYFDKLIRKTGKIDRVILLGDVKHAFGSIQKQERSDFLRLLDYFKDVEIVIVKGNHDKLLVYMLKEKKGVSLVDYYIWKDFCFMHGDRDFLENYDKKIKYWILGHGHPAIKISDGVKMEKYKCFLEGMYKGKKIIILPSFFAYSEGSEVRENDLGLIWNFQFNKFRVRVVSGDKFEVLDFGKLRKLK